MFFTFSCFPVPAVPLLSNSFLHSLSPFGLRGGQNLSLIILCGGVLSEPSLPLTVPYSLP